MLTMTVNRYLYPMTTSCQIVLHAISRRRALVAATRSEYSLLRDARYKRQATILERFGNEQALILHIFTYLSDVCWCITFGLQDL